jgi:hypothetical protein
MIKPPNPSDAEVLAGMWITSRCRIYAEKRFNLYDNASKVVLIYYSLILLLCTVFASRLESLFPHFNDLNIFLSIVVFSAALMIAGFGFEQKAARHRGLLP